MAWLKAVYEALFRPVLRPEAQLWVYVGAFTLAVLLPFLLVLLNAYKALHERRD